MNLSSQRFHNLFILNIFNIHIFRVYLSKISLHHLRLPTTGRLAYQVPPATITATGHLTYHEPHAITTVLGYHSYRLSGLPDITCYHLPTLWVFYIKLLNTLTTEN
jgi:hypothetical protein